GDHVLLHPLGDRPEAREDAHPRQRRREDDEDEGEPVDAELVLDAEGRDPVGLLDELEAAARLAAGDEPDEEEEREHPRRAGRGERHPASEVLPGPGQERDDDRPDERQERDDGEDRQAAHRGTPTMNKYEPAITKMPIGISIA